MLYKAILKVSHKLLFLDSSMVEHSAVNRVVVGSSPTRGALGSMVKRLRHRPFTAVTWVQIPLESLAAMAVEKGIWRHSQGVRQRSATPLSPVRIRVSPLQQKSCPTDSFFAVIGHVLPAIRKNNRRSYSCSVSGTSTSFTLHSRPLSSQVFSLPQ